MELYGKSWYLEDTDPHELHLYEVEAWLARQKTRFQDVGIIRNPSYGKILFIDGAVQSSQRDEYVYHEALVQPAMLLHPEPKRVLVLGAGEGASLREVLRHRSITQATMVDIDGELVDLCRKHLPEWSQGSFDDSRAQLVIADGKDWVERATERFDVILMDLTDQIDLGPSFQLYTQQFYQTLKKRLNPGGILVVQAGELSVYEYFSHSSIRKTLASVFPRTRTYLQQVPSFYAQWSFVIASEQAIPDKVIEKDFDRNIASRLTGSLQSVDGAAYNRMFSLPKDLTSLVNDSGIVVTSEEAFTAAYEACEALAEGDPPVAGGAPL
jgi:spermidine synthase